IADAGVGNGFDQPRKSMRPSRMPLPATIPLRGQSPTLEGFRPRRKQTQNKERVRLHRQCRSREGWKLSDAAWCTKLNFLKKLVGTPPTFSAQNPKVFFSRKKGLEKRARRRARRKNSGRKWSKTGAQDTKTFFSEKS
ncbi:hypothetical protein, partial [Martelella limonii]|uniref:hypothetical protein n=1 Tax=Martelella limonii TaxID=1647649 RepID=UPI00157FF7B1